MVVRDFTVATEERLFAELQNSISEVDLQIERLRNSGCGNSSICGSDVRLAAAEIRKKDREDLLRAIRGAFAAARETDSSYVQNTQHIGDNLDRYVQFVKSLTATIQGNVSAADIHAQLDGDATEFKKSIVYKGESKTPPDMTDKDYHALAGVVYKVNDPDFSLKPGDFVEPYFRVVAVADESNGMQAMAVAPIDNGSVDTSHIVVVYAGTKPEDYYEDVMEVMLQAPLPDGQLNTAKKFYDDVHDKYPNATFSVTGHSLGGFLAVHVAGENHVPATVFCAPNTAGQMSPGAREWVRGHREDYKNYQVKEDVISNFQGDELGIGIQTGSISREDGFLSTHGIASNFKFDDYGSVEVQGRNWKKSSGYVEIVEPVVTSAFTPPLFRHLANDALYYAERNSDNYADSVQEQIDAGNYPND